MKNRMQDYWPFHRIALSCIPSSLFFVFFSCMFICLCRIYRFSVLLLFKFCWPQASGESSCNSSSQEIGSIFRRMWYERGTIREEYNFFFFGSGSRFIFSQFSLRSVFWCTHVWRMLYHELLEEKLLTALIRCCTIKSSFFFFCCWTLLWPVNLKSFLADFHFLYIVTRLYSYCICICVNHIHILHIIFTTAQWPAIVQYII